MLSEEILKQFTEEEISATKRFQVTFPLVMWYKYMKPMMKRHGYLGNIGQCRFFIDASIHYLVYLAKREKTINSVNLVSDQQMDDDLEKALEDFNNKKT